MPVLDGNFEAFVTNLGKYNEGELVGEWVKFPISAEEMQKVFERIGIGSKDEFGQPYEEWFITDYECPVSGVYDISVSTDTSRNYCLRSSLTEAKKAAPL